VIAAPKSLLGQVAAYAIGGGGVTALHSAAYWIIAQPLGIEPYAANSVAAIIAGVTGYLLHSRWTFGHGRAAGMDAGTVMRFIAVSLICYAINSLWVWLVVKQGGYSVALSIVPMVLVTPWAGFVLNRFWTFRRP
jgi:putative flippase GtrA